MKRKDRLIKRGLLSLLLSVALSCVTPFTPDLNPEDTEPMLVVEGQITDREGPFTVKLSQTAPVSDSTTNRPVLNADVQIIDDLGHSFRLYSTGNGFYETEEKNLKGIPGNKYTLTITTLEDGRQYTSMPVLLQEVPDIDSLYFEEVKHIRITQGVAYEDTWLNILVDAHDATEKTKYWRWEFDETFEVNLVADPVRVFAAIGDWKNFTNALMAIYDEKKTLCWRTIPSASIVVASTINNQTNVLKGFIVRSIEPGRPLLHVRYSILVKQYSIDKDFYNYWKLLKDVNENPGGIYNKIPSPVFGNITCCDGMAKALGYFAASSLKEKRIFINRSDHHMETSNVNGGCTYFTYNSNPMRQPIFFGYYYGFGGGLVPVYTYQKDCADCTLNGTNVKPSFW